MKTVEAVTMRVAMKAANHFTNSCSSLVLHPANFNTDSNPPLLLFYIPDSQNDEHQDENYPPESSNP